MRREKFLQLKFQAGSASPVSFLKRNIVHQLKLLDPYLKINAVDWAAKDLYCGLPDDPI